MIQTFLVNTSDDDWLELWILLCQSNELVKEFAFICLFAQCIVKANFKKAGEICLLDPIDCTDGVAFSIFEKVSFSDKVLNIFRSHQRRYIFSTGKSNQASLFWQCPWRFAWCENLNFKQEEDTKEMWLTQDYRSTMKGWTLLHWFRLGRTFGGCKLGGQQITKHGSTTV